MLLALLLVASCVLARPDGLGPVTEDAADDASAEKVDMTTPKTAVVQDAGEGFVEGENDPIEDFTTIVPPDSGLDPDNATTPNSNTSTTLPPPTTSTQNATTSTSTTPANTTTTTSTTTETPTTNTTMTSTTTSTSTVTSTSVTPNVTTSVPVNPDSGKGGGFDGWSFFGGIILALVGVAISFLSVKYWKVRRAQTTGGNYNRF